LQHQLNVSSIIPRVTGRVENSGGDGNTLNDIIIAANCKSGCYVLNVMAVVTVVLHVTFEVTDAQATWRRPPKWSCLVKTAAGGRQQSALRR
jgi:hypothetical protein